MQQNPKRGREREREADAKKKAPTTTAKKAPNAAAVPPRIGPVTEQDFLDRERATSEGMPPPPRKR